MEEVVDGCVIVGDESQVKVKSEEVYVEQPSGFMKVKREAQVLKLNKALYGDENKILLVAFYVDTMLFGGNDKKMIKQFKEEITQEFEIIDLGLMKYFLAGANNDINVLDNSPLFDDLLDDLALAVPYVVNGVEYRNGYYLADGIYPEWASFVKSFTVATDPKHTYFKQHQESARKDVERAFGVL
nr:protein ALP1-like [Tanacetum cinerariifolium]